MITFMSGDFVQRGAPALLDKYTRTRMALLCGADAVIELPTLYAAASAEYFAQGAVTLMSQLGVVDLLSFGSESGDLSSLSKAAELLLSREPADLTQLLKKGLSYPAARTQSFSSLSGDLQDLLVSPNNILGVEYCKALFASRSQIRPFTIARKGNGYHDLSLQPGPEDFSSASSIRAFLSREAAGNAVKILTFYCPCISRCQRKPLRFFAPLSKTGLIFLRMIFQRFFTISFLRKPTTVILIFWTAAAPYLTRSAKIYAPIRAMRLFARSSNQRILPIPGSAARFFIFC